MTASRENLNATEAALSESAAKRILADPKSALALDTIAKLSSAGYIAYLAGGCVRDALWGKIPKDYDVATNAHPEQIRRLFGYNRTIAIGAAFGVITVMGNRHDGLTPVEVATFRSDGEYSDGRRPDSVHYSDPEMDAQRRDFTINGLFFDPTQQRVIDFVDGVRDLRAGLIRAIRNPVERFREDKLRLLRAVRFATTFAFQLEPETLQAVMQHASDVTICSGERIGAEMRRILASDKVSTGIRLLMQTRLADAIMPTLQSALSQPRCLKRTCNLLDHCDSEAFQPKLAILLMETGDQANINLITLAAAWHLSNEERDAIQTAIDDSEALLQADELLWSELQPFLVRRYRETSVSVARTIAKTVNRFQSAIQRIDQSLQLPTEQLNPPPLLTGNDLIGMGMNPGPDFRLILQSVRDQQLDGKIATKADAVKAALGQTNHESDS